MGCQHPQQAGVGTEILQAMIAIEIANRRQPGDPDGRPVEVAVGPELTEIVRSRETVRPPVGKAVQQHPGIGVCRPGIGAGAGRHKLFDDDVLQLVVELVVVVGLHVVHDGDVVVLDRRHRAVLVEHQSVGRNGQIDLVAEAVDLLLARLAFDLFHFLAQLLGAAGGFLMRDHFRILVQHEAVFRSRSIEIPERFDEVGFLTRFDITIEEVVVDRQADPVVGQADAVAAIGLVFGNGHRLHSLLAGNPQQVVGATQVVRVDLDGPVQQAFDLELEGAVVVDAFHVLIEGDHIDLHDLIVVKIGLQQGVRVRFQLFPFKYGQLGEELERKEERQKGKTNFSHGVDLFHY